MDHRPWLTSFLKKCWKKSIKTDYQSQLINSERSLQASLWGNLSRRLKPPDYRLFIEPGFRIESSKDGVVLLERRLPDFVICDASKIICFVEIKYLPNGPCKINKDLETFQWFSQNRNAIFLNHFRYRGVGEKLPEFPIADNILFVWAGVHRKLKALPKPVVSQELAGNLLLLHAQTSHNSHPTLHKRPF